MGKLPIEKNYGGRMEQLDSQPYFSKGISRRGFLKGAAGLAGAAIFGEGFLKQMEAWAQDGVSVYIEDFTESYLTDQFQHTANNIGLSVSKNLKLNLNSRGITIADNPDGGIIVWGHCEERYDNSQGPMIYVNIGYKINGRPVKGGVTEYYPVGQQMFKMGDITNKVYSDLMQLKGTKNKKNLEEIGLGPNARKMMEDPAQRERLIKSFEKDGYVVEGNKLFKIKD
ncbi:MAG: twin-arginine translocation signal domain-containing protein [Candidatus Aenigmarchaeota archaeon]|nr:twin-arginine translocation signal domain-containing protein [Candidatus Aenigmarchaeota archaeon]